MNLDNINRDNVQAWLDALRSGEYQQGRKFLSFRQKGTGKQRFCCLGVACEIMGLPKETDGLSLGYEVVRYGGVTGMPPRQFYDWLGLTMDDDHAYDFATECSRMNDSRGYSFAEIADFIEKELLG